MFANDRSDRKTLKRYQGMLGGCIDKGWSTGYQGEDKQEVDEAAVNYATKERAFLKSRRTMPTDILKTDAAKGCKASQQVLQERQIK